jgi:uncharacterized protein YbbC (DUF1343 family)
MSMNSFNAAPHRRGFIAGALSVATAGGASACAANGTTQAAREAGLSGTGGQISGPAVSLGIDVLAADGFAALAGQRVGFITNQTSVDQAGTMSRVVLQRGLGTRLVALFGPEHGLDTRVRAGEHVANARDSITGLNAYSLYGATRKPTPAMLANLDVMVFDIQDIGVRSYTYISTMALAMEACGEAGKRFVVLDRPNPLGGLRVQGPGLEPEFTSFVSQVPVPYVHGLTIGELARMMVAKRWIRAVPELEVIAMDGWRRTMDWADTGLNWVATSPNIPTAMAPFYCAVTGILGELRDVDIGIGTPKAFKIAAGRGIDAAALARDLAALAMPGVSFSPYVSVARPGFAGVELEIDPDGNTDLMALAMAMIVEINTRAGGEPWRASTANNRDLLNKVYGSRALAQTLETGGGWQALTADWPRSNALFDCDRGPHLLYG